MNPLPLTFVLKKEDGILKISGLSDKLFMEYVKSIPEGTLVEVTYEVKVDDGSYSQLSKLHKCIREVSNFTGITFNDLKRDIKSRAGLETPSGMKSFADCSKEELNNCIQIILEIGDFVGCPLQ